MYCVMVVSSDTSCVVCFVWPGTVRSVWTEARQGQQGHHCV